MTSVHPTAIVAGSAELHESARIGPYAIIGENVSIGEGSVIGSHAIIDGHTTIGRDNTIYSHACVGTPPQDKKYEGEASALTIGDGNVIREFATLNPGTEADRGSTDIGNNNLLMAYVHVAHDCIIHNNCVFSNSAQLAGHVEIEDGAIVGGMTGVHQFVRVGTGAMVGGGSMITLDIPPYCIAAGNRATLHGLNLVGLKRQTASTDAITALKECYRLLFRQGLLLKDAMTQAEAVAGNISEARRFLKFVADSERGVCRPEV